jgi:hypothetical protein
MSLSFSARLRASVLALVLATLIVSLEARPGGSEAHAAVSATLVPSSGAWFGAYVQPTRWTQTAIKADIQKLESDVGRKLDIDQHYYGWAEWFPTWAEKWDLANGRFPMVSWAGTNIAEINAGAHDALIRARADSVQGLGKKIFIRWFPEMDDPFHASTVVSPAQFIAAWRRIVGIFDRRSATNVVWVWCGTAYGFKTGEAQKFYPGDAYVDWTCADGFNWAPGRPTAGWTKFAGIFSPFYSWGAPKGKPMMIGETGTEERYAGEKMTWITDARNALKNQFPKIKAFIYFDSKTTDFTTQVFDWRVDTSWGSYDAFKKFGRDWYFRQRHW